MEEQGSNKEVVMRFLGKELLSCCESHLSLFGHHSHLGSYQVGLALEGREISVERHQRSERRVPSIAAWNREASNPHLSHP
jgi:hypothetical protein